MRSIVASELKAPRGRHLKEGLIQGLLASCSLVAVLITAITAGTFILGSLPFFQRVSLGEFLGSLRWAPLTVPQSYGVLALIADTLVITGIALAVALPLGLLSAVFLSEYASERARRLLKPSLELLAGIPTVVYGFFALRFVTPALQQLFPGIGFWNGLSAGVVMGFMILPLVASLSEDVLYAVPRSLREAAYALGATKFEVISRVVIPAGLSGIGAAFILAMSRAIGETMIVALATGRTPAWPPDPTQPMMVLTTTIVNIATGDHEATAFIWSALFAIGLLLFVITLVLNIASYFIVRASRSAMNRRLWRRSQGALFALLAALSLALGLIVVAVLLRQTLLSSSQLIAMRATADAGVSLSLRSLQLEVGGDQRYFPYVTLAQVARGSPAEKLGLHQGDALIRVADLPVQRVSAVWEAVERAPGGQEISLRISWVPAVKQLLGELRAEPIPHEIGRFRVRLAKVAAGSPAERAGLKPEDVLLAAGGLPITGTRQAWEAIVITTQISGGPISLRVEREGRFLDLPLDASQQGDLPLKRNALRALWAFVSNLNEPRYPEQAGLASAILGSFYVMLVMATVAFPLGIGAAIYLEEYASRHALLEIIQVLIANLAGVPSVVYGIIGLEILARGAGLGRSILAGGIALALLILPVMIMATREALRSVPPWVREAALSMGATPWQAVRHHVLPYALPGIFTAMILTLSRAIGEAALLILLGAFLYVTYLPTSLKDSFTVIPLAIFDWATKPQEGFATIASAAIVVLLGILLLLNMTAIVLRNRFQRRW